MRNRRITLTLPANVVRTFEQGGLSIEEFAEDLLTTVCGRADETNSEYVAAAAWMDAWLLKECP